MPVPVGVDLKMNNRDFVGGVAGAVAAWKVLQKEIQGQNRQLVAHQRVVNSTRGEYEKLSNTIRGASHSAHLLSLNFYELRTAIRNTVTRTAITGFAAVAGAITSIASAAVSALGSVTNLGAVLGIVGGTGLAAGLTAIGVTALGLNKVLKALITTGKDHEKAMNKLTTTARNFVKALAPLRDEFRRIQLLSQEGLFPGLIDALKRIQPLFKIFDQTVYDTARNMGYLADRGAAMLAKRAGLIKKILNNQGLLIQRYGRALENFGAGILDTWVASIPLIDHVAARVERFSKKFKSSMSEWRKNGSLGEFFGNFKESFDNWTSILGGFGKTFFNIWKASQPSVHKLERDVKSIFGTFADWTKNHANELEGFFDRMLVPTEAFAKLVGSAAASLVRIGSIGADTTTALFDGIRVKVLPIVEQLATTLNENVVGGLGHAMSGLLDFVSTGLPALENLLKPLGAIAHGFGNIFDAASDLVRFAQKHFGDFGGMIATYLSVTAIAASWAALRIQVSGVMALLGSPIGIASRGAKNAQSGVVGLVRNPRRAMAGATPVIISPYERRRQANLERLRRNENFSGQTIFPTGRKFTSGTLTYAMSGDPREADVLYGRGPQRYPTNYGRTSVVPGYVGRRVPIGATMPIPIGMAQPRMPAPGFGDYNLRQVPVSQIPPWFLTPRGGRKSTRQRQFQWMTGEQTSMMNTPTLAPWERGTQARQFTAWQRSMQTGAGVMPFRTPRPPSTALKGGAGADAFKQYQSQMEKSTKGGFLKGLKGLLGGGKGTAAAGVLASLTGSVALALAVPVGIAAIGMLGHRDKRPQIVQDVEAIGRHPLPRVAGQAARGPVPLMNNPAFTRLGGQLNAAIKAGDPDKIRKIRDEFSHLNDTFTQIGKNDGLGKIQSDIGTLVAQASNALLGKVAPDFDKFSGQAHDSVGHVLDSLNVLKTQIVVKMPVAGREYKSAMASAFAAAAASIQLGIDQGLINEKKGLKEIHKLLIKEYKSLGFSAEAAGHLAAGGGDVRGATGGNEHTPPVKGPTAVEPNVSAPRQHGTTGAARGMYMRGKGRVGADSVPLNVDGQRIITAPGEYVGVFTRHQQRAMEQATGQPIDQFFASHKTPHYASQGGIWKLGQRIQSESYAGVPYSVGENPHFGGVHPVHMKGSLHYSGRALDINHDVPPGSEPAALDKLASELRGQGWHVLWRVPGHFDHLHVDDASGGGAIGSATAKMLKPPRANLPGLFGGLVQGVLNRATTGANVALRSVAAAAGGTGGSLEGSVPTSGGGGKNAAANKAIARRMMRRFGWGSNQWPPLDRLGTQESGWKATALNSSSGAFGIGQFLGKTKDAYAKYGATSSDPAQQINAMFHYIKDRYGNPSAAWAHEVANNWYYAGGPVPPKPYGNKLPPVNPDDAITGGSKPKPKKPKKKKKKKPVRIAGGKPALGGGIGLGSFKPKGKKPRPHARNKIKKLISAGFRNKGFQVVDPITGEDLGITKYGPTQRIARIDGDIGLASEALDRLISTQGLTDEQAIVTVNGQDVINPHGMTVDGKFVGGIDQAVAEFNAQIAIHQSVIAKYAKEQSIAKAIPSQSAILERIERLKRVKKVFQANVELRKSYAKKLNGMKSKNYTWQEAVAHNQDIITKWAHWKRDSINEPQSATDLANHEQDRLRGLNDSLRRAKPKGTVYGSEEYRNTLGVYENRGVENRLLVGDKDATSWNPGSAGGFVGRVSNALSAWRQVDTVRKDTLENAKSGIATENLNIASLLTTIGDWTGTTPPKPTTDTSQLDQMKLDATLDSLKQKFIEISQLDVLKGFAPLLSMRLVGAYAHGGLVNETGMALVHKGEHISPSPDGPFRRGMNAPQQQSYSHVTELHLHGRAGELVDLIDTRVRKVAHSSVSHAQARNVRSFSASPGGR